MRVSRYAALVSIKGSDSGEKRQAGLCADCVHSQRVESARGSVFWLCELSRSNPAYPKYPRLPVLSCPGYRQIESAPSSET